MNDKIIFREMLTEIGELAQAKNNKLTVDEIKGYFKEISLSDKQMELVYSYLEANKIEIEGHKKNDNMKMFEVKEEAKEQEIVESDEAPSQQIQDSDANRYLEMYLEELDILPVVSEKDKIALLNQAISGDSLAKSKMIEIYLKEVVEIAKNYVGKGILISDLIQEGNIGLMLAMDKIADVREVGEVDEVLREGIVSAIENVIEENEFIHIAKKQIVSKVNFLNEGVNNLEEELGRTVSIEELAKYMEMSEEEVRDIIRVSDDEIKVKENEEKKNNR